MDLFDSESNLGKTAPFRSSVFPLNPISKQLYEFIQTYPSTYYFKFTSSSKHILKPIIEELKFAEKQSSSVKFEEIPYSGLTDSEILSSVPTKIREHITRWRTKTCRTYRFPIGERAIKIDMCLPHAHIEDSFFKKSLKLIYMWLSVATKYATKGCSQHMNIYLYLTDLPKQKGDSRDLLGPLHANTAYTHVCSSSTDMVVFRQEEWFKVLIHETFHNLGLDFSTMNIAKVKEILASHFHVNSKYDLYETYNETWAELINLIFLGVLSRQSVSHMIRNIENLMNMEIRFSMFQSVKVLQHHHLTYLDILTDKKTNTYREDTNVFCYYVLKSLMLFLINDFMIWCREHNENLFNFNKKYETLENFGKFIIRQSHNPKYLQELRHMEAWYHTQSTNTGLNETMRMTIFG
jgi:hypothetical protein